MNTGIYEFETKTEDPFKLPYKEVAVEDYNEIKAIFPDPKSTLF